jgi:hypothetical protein
MASMSKFVAALLIVLLFSGCVRGRGEPVLPAAVTATGPGLSSASPQAATEPSATAAPIVTPTPADLPAPTLAITPTRTLGPDDPPYNLEGLKSWLSQAWRAGLPSGLVRSRLEAVGWLSAELYHFSIGEAERELSAWQALDMDGDGREEWLFAPAIEINACGFPAGGLWLASASGVITWEGFNQENSLGAPLVIDQTDFNGDGLTDVLAYAGPCQADTQNGAFFIFSLLDAKFEDLISLDNDLFKAAEPLRSGSGSLTKAQWPGPAIAMTEPTYEILDVTGDGLPDLVLNGGTYRSSGAGEVRPRSETWSWDGRAISLEGIWWQPSGQRFDTLYDANLALDLGDLAEAEGLYVQVLQDDALLDGVGLASPEENRAAARQFAAFRLEVIGMLRGSLSAAQHYRDYLQAEYPDAPLTFAAIQMLEYWRASATPYVPAACQSAGDLLAGFENPTGSLVGAGHGLPSLGAGDVCPRSMMQGN